jgi:uncharacterized protein YdaU (DUF1376 family)
MSVHVEPTQTPQLPPPPVSAEVDLRRYPTLPLDVQRLRDSDFVALVSADEFRAGVLLISAAWHQLPAGSLPTDDRLLCALAKTEKKTWSKVKQGALRGFVKHSDGRLYHPVLTETVLKSWASMNAQKGQTAAATAARKALKALYDARHDDRHDDRNDDRNDERNDHQRKGKERNITKTQPPPPPAVVVVRGGGVFEKEDGLGDMLAGVAGFDDHALLASLTKAAAGASGEQLERAAAAIKAAGTEIKNPAGWALTIARKAAAGQVTSPAEPAATLCRPGRHWDGKVGWRIDTEQFGQLTVESNGMLRAVSGILHPQDAIAIAARVKSGELTLQP